MKFNKKAAMELGISTVVMLVIAIVIIGGGITFIRGFFTKGTDTLSNSFDLADFGLEPSASEPLVLIDGKMNIKTGREDVVRVGFYNRHGDTKNVSVGFGNCITTVATDSACGEGGIPKPQIKVLPEVIDVGASAPFGTQVIAKCAGEVEGNLPAGTYTCSLVAFECGTDIDTCMSVDYNASIHTALERSQIIFQVNS